MVGGGGRPALDLKAPPPDIEALKNNVPKSFRVPSWVGEMKRVGACDGCKRPGIEPGQCCREISIPWPDIGDVRHREDSDYLRWLISHEGVSYQSGCVVIRSRCRWLTEEGDCAIYENRPQLCKEWPQIPDDLEDYPDCTYRFKP